MWDESLVKKLCDAAASTPVGHHCGFFGKPLHIIDINEISIPNIQQLIPLEIMITKERRLELQQKNWFHSEVFPKYRRDEIDKWCLEHLREYAVFDLKYEKMSFGFMVRIKNKDDFIVFGLKWV